MRLITRADFDGLICATLLRQAGVADSHRSDVAYEDFRGLKLDREMLKVLQAG